MSDSTAKKWLVISALSVFGIWWYRRWREGPDVLGTLGETPKFIAAWGATFFTLALITEASPSFGGSFSILVMVGDLLGNAMPKKGGGILKDITTQQSGKAAKGKALGGWDQAAVSQGQALGSGALAATGVMSQGQALGTGATTPSTTPTSQPVPSITI